MKIRKAETTATYTVSLVDNSIFSARPGYNNSTPISLKESPQGIEVTTLPATGEKKQ